jgi:hypothetical protein
MNRSNVERTVARMPEDRIDELIAMHDPSIGQPRYVR